MKGIRIATLITIIWGIPSMLLASGMIKGVVYDARSGKGLPFANVYLEGTKIGTSTDESGFFVLKNVPPGDYQITATMLSYKPQTQKVKVKDGETVTIDFYLQEEAIQLSELTVVGKRPLIEKELSASVKTIGKNELNALGTVDVRQVLAQQAAVSGEGTDLHVRGGRSNEILLMVDGIPIRDPLSGSAFAMHIPTTAVRELEALTGGFNAEYGQAMSGVINIEIREGGSKFRAEGSYQKGIYSVNSTPEVCDTFPNAAGCGDRLHDAEEGEISLSGPVPGIAKLTGGRWTFFSNIYWKSNDTYLPHIHNLYSSVFRITMPREENTLSALSKVTWRISDNKKLYFIFSRSIGVNQGYFISRNEYPFSHGFPYRYIKILDHYPIFTRDGNQQMVAWHHVINPQNYYDIKLSRFFTNLHIDVAGKHWSEYQEILDIEPFDPISGRIGDGFWDVGDSPYWHDHYAEQYSLKFDYTSQISAVQTIKFGLLNQYSEVQWIDIQYPWFYSPDGLGYNHDLYKAYTDRGGMYVQTRLHFAGMVANLGLRLDYWIPGSYVDRGVESALARYDLPDIVRGEYEQYLNNTFKLGRYRAKAHLSPRIGVAYPVTDRDKFFFSYGHFSQMPDFKYVYSKLGVRATSGYELVGNPNLNPTITVAYELGVEHLLSENTKLKVTAYYKDIYNYPTAMRVPGVPPNPDYWMYFNSDYARSTGIEFELKKRLTKRFYANADFTLSQSKGRASTAEDLYLQPTERGLREWYLRWDRPYKLYLNIGWRIKKGDHPVIGRFVLPDDWDMNITVSYQAGRRYTPMDSSGVFGEPNSKIGPPWHHVDLRFTKNFTLRGRSKLSLTVLIYNLFNHRNEYWLDPLTGRAYRQGDPLPPLSNPMMWLNPARYRAPRQINIGLGVKF